jgi:hypothetical protein
MICRLSFFSNFYRHGHHILLYTHTYIGVVPIATITARPFCFSFIIARLVVAGFFWAIGFTILALTLPDSPPPSPLSPSPVTTYRFLSFLSLCCASARCLHACMLCTCTIFALVAYVPYFVG